MAFVVVVLVLLMIGILEFGWVTKNNMTLASAAREGARVAAVGSGTDEITSAINRYARPLVLSDPSGSITLQQCDEFGANCGTWPGDDTSVSPPRNNVKAPRLLRVTLTLRHQSLTGLVPGLNNRVLTSTVALRRES